MGPKIPAGLAAALRLASAGFAVIPVRAGTKRPHIKDWPDLATTDGETIPGWWSKWPDANPGYVTGEKSGVIVVEVDPRNGGEESLAALETDHGPMPATEVVYSGRNDGGRHLLFRWPGFRVRNNAGTLLGPGIDIKGDRGFVLGPGALHPKTGQPYWVDRGDPDDDGDRIDKARVAEAPDWLVKLLRRRSEQHVDLDNLPPVEDRWDIPMAERAARCRAYLARCPDAISGQRGHDKTFRAACECYRFGLDHEAAAEQMAWWSLHKSGDEPWSGEELRHKLEDAYERVVADGEFGMRLAKTKRGEPTPVVPPLPSFDGPRKMRLIAQKARRAPTRQTVTFTVECDGRQLPGDLSATTTTKGRKTALADLIQLLKDEGLTKVAVDESALRKWLRKVLSDESVTEIRRSLDRRSEVLARLNTEGVATMLDIAIRFMRDYLDLRFVGTRGALWSERFGRSILQREFASLAPPELLQALRAAADYAEPTDSDPTKPIRHMQQVLKPAWAALSASLPDELGASLGPGSRAAAALQRRIVLIWTTPECWTRFPATDAESAHVERTSLASRVRALIDQSKRPAEWSRVLRGVEAFYRVIEPDDVRLAMRAELCAGQIKGQVVERVGSQQDLEVLLGRYGLSDDGPGTTTLIENGRAVPVVALSKEMSDLLVYGLDGGDESGWIDPETGEIKGQPEDGA